MQTGPRLGAFQAAGSGREGRVGEELPLGLKLLTYDPAEDALAVDFTAGAAEIKSFAADAVLIIGFSWANTSRTCS
ncbi:hypothetical protein [Micromonospora coriariae]|uniref:hypothetical protein n=1 Tax=Micromonospora coriariae TaxID=285665 RepID=UPI000B5AE8A1|nr:hypothetical protein [Micromonospora coriariae]